MDDKLTKFCSDKQVIHGPLIPKGLSKRDPDDGDSRVYVESNTNRAIKSELKHTIIRLPMASSEKLTGKVAFIPSYDVYIIPSKSPRSCTISLMARIVITSDPEVMSSGISGLDETPIKEHIRNTIKSNLIIKVKDRSYPIKVDLKDPEHIALLTLREMVSEVDFRRYLKYGFIIVSGKSGRSYQIFRKQSHTKVFMNGSLKEEVCVRLRGGVPPTDNVIAFKTLIETSEDLFRSSGNIYKRK